MLELQMREFEKYYKKFDITDENISRKYNHSIRVMKFSIQIAKSLNLSSELIEVIGLAGLLHDIGRFEQWEKFKTYSDLKSIDHAKLGVEILKKYDYIRNYIKDEKYINLILTAVAEHNSYKISENLSLDETLICQIIRDADKLDILETQGNILNTTEKFHKDVIENIYKEQCCRISTSQNETDRIIRFICFVFDINFQYSFKYIKDKNILNSKINLIKNNAPDGVNLLDVEKHLNEYLDSKIS